MTTKVFKGVNVFISRNLIPPELFDSLHDALKLNGAQVFLCCDPSRNSPNDYHVISSPDHEKFEDLRSKGCNLIGPQCVLSCAKEHRPLPKQVFSCCLAMDGVKLLTSGFEMDEKAEIAKLVTAMGGVLQMKASMDVSFVIVKNVLAAKYKWAVNVLKKPIVTINWLLQCWKEHRVVPQESYRVLPFSGLTICVSRISADERKQMEKLIIQNGGKYSAELTKKCTHLVCDTPEGDKYKVAKRWGHVHIITKKWFDQSVTRRACLNEESYTVQESSTKTVKKMAMTSQDKSLGNSQCEPLSAGTVSGPQAIWYTQKAEPDSEATISHGLPSTFCDAPIFSKGSGQPAEQLTNDSKLDGCVADDSQTEDNDLYLAVCRIMLIGFNASDMRKLVSMVRRGGGSRYMSYNEKITHIIVGTPSESEVKEVRNLAALGVIYVVKTEWLEDCVREKREVPVIRRHIAYDLLLPRDPICSTERLLMGMNEMRQGKASDQPILPDDFVVKDTNSGSGVSSEKRKELNSVSYNGISLGKTGNHAKQQQSYAFDRKGDTKTLMDASHKVDSKKSSNVFAGKQFCFSGSFPADQRAEIIEWVNQGGGEVVENQVEANVQFIVECHGVVPSETDFSMSKYVSSHWIRSSLMEGRLLDVSSHILYSPLPCQVPFLGFKSFRFCVSQYEEKERLLLRNLCFILGVRFFEKLTKKVTHLFCKFTSGPKYEAACKWGIQTVTSEWVYECVKQNKVVAPGPFFPKEVTSQDQEAGACTMTQYPTQAVWVISGDDTSQLSSQSQALKNVETEAFTNKSNEVNYSIGCTKKARIFEADKTKSVLSESNTINSICRLSPMEKDVTENAREVTKIVPDVAAAIEDLLEQTSKIHDQKSHTRNGCNRSLFMSDCTVLGQDHGKQSALGLPKHWINRFDKMDDIHNPQENIKTSDYDCFTDTQTESQVVGYAEDLSGRQMIIDRVRTRNSMT